VVRRRQGSEKNEVEGAEDAGRCEVRWRYRKPAVSSEPGAAVLGRAVTPAAGSAFQEPDTFAAIQSTQRSCHSELDSSISLLTDGVV
jgi:hypothetical protein